MSEISRVAEFCGLAPRGNRSEVGDCVAHELRHYVSETPDLLNATMIPVQLKLFYFCLHAVSSRAYLPRSSPSGTDMTSELVDKLSDLMTEIEDHEKGAQLQIRRQLNERSQQVFDLERQLRELQKQNLGLHEFSIAVRSTFVYRFYRKCLKPLGIGVR